MFIAGCIGGAAFNVGFDFAAYAVGGRKFTVHSEINHALLGCGAGLVGVGLGNVLSGAPGIDAAEELPTLEIDATRMPTIARNIDSAQRAGLPSLLNRETDPVIIQANRAAACAGFCGSGSPDEYPIASTIQDGAGAQVSGVPLAEQRIQGGVLSQFYRQYSIGQGDAFRVVVRLLEGGGE